jgi:hypothetical protein
LNRQDAKTAKKYTDFLGELGVLAVQLHLFPAQNRRFGRLTVEPRSLHYFAFPLLPAKLAARD